MNQSGLKTNRDAKTMALLGFYFLIFTAILGLNSMPYHWLIRSIFTLSSGHLVDALKSYSPVFLILFLFSRPQLHWYSVVVSSGIVISAIFSLNSPDTALYTWQLNQLVDDLLTFSNFTAVAASTVLVLRVCSIIKTSESAVYEKNLRHLFVLILVLIAIPSCALELEISIHPEIIDFIAIHWDSASHLSISPELHHLVDLIPGLPELVFLVYTFTPIGFLFVCLFQLNGFPKQTASGAKTWVVLSACALLAYNFFPITGPRYVFGSEYFVNKLGEPSAYPLSAFAGSTAPRNGMPSMHFGWMLASTILWWRTVSTWWSRMLFIFATLLTAIATIYLGEHYVVDLIVAVPFTLAAIALCTNNVSWAHAERKWTVIGGFLTWFIWVVVLRELVPFAEQHHWFCWVMNGSTSVVVIFQCIAMKRFAQLAQLPVEDASTDCDNKTAFFSTFERKVSAMFFASGAAALIYQVLFAKTIALTFGSTSTATLTVLATFLGGMAIGAFLGGKFASQTKRPLFTYAIIEGLIALYCIATPMLFHGTQTIYVTLAMGLPPEAPALLLLKVCLGGIVLLAPTIMMGATLPLLAQVLDVKTQKIGIKIALLYLTNTAGATIGALVCGYLFIPAVGVTNTTLIAALLNFLVALGGLELNKTFIFHPVQREILTVRPFASLPDHATPLALITLGLGGIASLGLEVTYVHMLSIVAGNSVYAFSLMLATFLSGLSIGGFLFKSLLERNQPESLRWLAYAFVGLALSTACSTYFWNVIPDYFASFTTHPPARTFVAREAIRAVVCALIMLPPTIFIGGAYVLGMDIITCLAPNNQIRTIGVGAAINTTGNIIGVLLFGFFLLPTIGGIQSIHVISLISFLLSILIVSLSGLPAKKRSFFWLGMSGFTILICLQVPLNYQALSSGANVYFAPQSYGRVIDHAESIDGGLTSVTQVTDADYKTLLTNGKFQGNNAWQGEMKAQIGFAFVPLLHQEKRERALVIGYGTGVTSRVFKEAGFKDLDIAELSSDVIRMANKHFGDVNQHVSELPQVHLHVTDGRNMLLLAPRARQYDIISLEITSIWFAGAASLYNQEFYQLVKAHLQPDGILQQWVQLHHLNPTDILSIISTIRSEFKYVSLYQLGGQGILIASNEPSHKDFNTTAIHAVEKTPPLLNILQRGKQSIELVKESRELDSNSIDQYLIKVGVDPNVWVSNDNNLRLEYTTPKGNVNDTAASYANNMHILRQYRNNTNP